MVQESKREAEKTTSDIIQIVDQHLEMLVTPINAELRYVTIAREVVLKKIYETSALVNAQTAGLVELNSNENVVKIHPCIMAEAIMDIYWGRRIYITMSNFNLVDVHRLQHQTT